MTDTVSDYGDDRDDERDGRQYKIAADAAFQKNLIRETVGFDAAFKRWTERNKMVSRLHKGTYNPKHEINGGKVAYTVSLQMANLALAILCIIFGAWPAIFFSVPALVAFNYYVLIKDRGL